MIKLNLPWITTKQDLIWHIDNLYSRLNRDENNNFRPLFTLKLDNAIQSLKQDISQTQNVLPLRVYKNKYQDVLNQLCQTEPYEFKLLELSHFGLFGAPNMSRLIAELVALTLIFVSLRHLCYHIFLSIKLFAFLFESITLVSLPLTLLSSTLLAFIYDIIFDGARMQGFCCFITILAMNNSSFMGQYIFSMSAITTSIGFFLPYLLGLIIVNVMYEVYQKTHSYFKYKKDSQRYTFDLESEINMNLNDIESSFVEYIVAAKALEKISLKLNFSNDILTPALAFFAPHSAISNHAKSQKNICYQKLSEYIDRLTDHGLKSKLSDLLNEYLERGDTQLFTEAIQEIEMATSMNTVNVFEDTSLLNTIKTFLLERIPTPSNSPGGL